MVTHSQPSPHLAGVVQDAEVGLISQVPGALEFGVAALLLGDLLHKRLVRGLGEPALLVQQGQETWRVGLTSKGNRSQSDSPSLGTGCCCQCLEVARGWETGAWLSS